MINDDPQHQDSVRPVVHFTPPQGWLNDPNGLLSVGGVHHLFYQHHPDDASLGPMHWGHAVSHDFVTWHHLPIALAPDELGTIFSGSAVTDVADSAGFGAGALVAVFTYHTDAGQSQALAWSTDGGDTFSKYRGNPVIPIADDRPMSRDPGVFWYSDGESGHWVMALAAEREVRIFASSDLRAWTLTDAVGGFDTIGDDRVDADVETPDMFPLVADDGATRWVLAVGLSQDAPAGGCGTAAVIGDFDGTHFRPIGRARWVDFGRHFYAAQSWNDLEDRRVWVGWMGNWHDDRDRPSTATWRGQMSIPREIVLSGRHGDYRLAQRPVRELERYRRVGCVDRDIVLTAEAMRPAVRGRALDIDLVGIDAGSGGIEVVCRRGDERVTVSLRDGRLVVTAPPLDADGPTDYCAPLDAGDLVGVDLRIVLDVTSVEVWCATAMISSLFPGAGGEWDVELSAASDALIQRLSVHALDAATRSAR